MKHSAEYSRPVYEYQRAPYLFYNVSYTDNLSYFDPFEPDLGVVTPLGLIYRTVNASLRLPYAVGQSIIDQVSSGTGIFGLPPTWVDVLKAIAGLLGGVVLAGIVVLWIQREFLLPLFLCLNFVAIAVLPWPEQSWRYLNPLVPILLIALFSFLQMVRKAGEKRNGQWRLLAKGMPRAAVFLLFLLLTVEVSGAVHTVIFIASNDFRGSRAPFPALHYNGGWRELDEAMKWLRLEARPSDVIVSSVPGWIYLHTGNRSVMPPFDRNPISRERLLRSTGVRYAVIETMGGATITTNYLQTLMGSPNWRIAFGDFNAPVSIYEFCPADNRPPFVSSACDTKVRQGER